MPFAQHFHISKTSSSRSVLMMSALCLSLFLSGCNKNESTPQAESPKTIELIPQDLVAVKQALLSRNPHLPALFAQSTKAVFRRRFLPLPPVLMLR